MAGLSEALGREKAKAARRDVASRTGAEMALAAKLFEVEADKREALQRLEQAHAQAFSALEGRMQAEQQKVVADAEAAKVEAASVIAALQSKLKTLECKEQLRDLEQAVPVGSHIELLVGHTR